MAVIAVNAIPIPNIDVKTKQGYSPLIWTDSALVLAMIGEASNQADALIVSIHWGEEYAAQPGSLQVEMAQQFIEAGADLVVGHHPHVVQRVDIYGKSVIAYSLGNLLSDQEFGETTEGLAIRAFFDTRGLRAVQVIPIQSGPHPRLLTLAESGSFLDRTLPTPGKAVYECSDDTCQPAKSEPSWVEAAGISMPQGIFWYGEADLTGDGVSEQVQRQAGQVTVYSQSSTGPVADWQTPEEWEVVDAALGDPDSDGRQELALAFWKPDQQGTLRSHPFLIGYREGRYRETWGGSAVSDPILEIEISDVDHDGEQELIVLEQRKNAQAITVWDWHGWGYSLKWRSPEGTYSNLIITTNGQIVVNMGN